METKPEIQGQPRAKIAKVLDAHIESGHFVAEDIWERQHRHPLQVKMDPLDSAAIEDITKCPFESRRPMKQAELDAQAEMIEQHHQALRESEKQGIQTIKWAAIIIGAVVVVIAIALVVVLRARS